MLKLHEIRRVHVELTTRCNARCPMCPRNYRGYPYNAGYPLTELTLEQFKKIFYPEFVQQLVSHTGETYRNPPGINFNGNLGDFSSAKDALEIVEYISSYGVKSYINTNGSLRPTEWWQKLAKYNVEVGFAIDGLSDTHSLYRIDTDWYRVIANAQAFIQAGGRAAWRFVPLDHNRHQEEECKQLAKSMGFIRFENIFDGRDNTPVFNRNGEFQYWIGTPDPAGQIPKIQELLDGHINWHQVPGLTHEKDQPNVTINCLHKNNKEIYVTANGEVYPCCFLGFYPKSMTHPGNNQLKGLVKENNALEYDLNHCIKWFNLVEESWRKESISQGRLYQCVATCGQCS